MGDLSSASDHSESECKDYEFEEDTTSKLTQLEAIAFCCILEDTIDQLSILIKVEYEKTIAKESLNFLSLETRAEKFTKRNPLYNFLNGELYEELMRKLRYLKLQLDRTFLEDILLQTNAELKNNHKFNSLINFVEKYHQSEADEEALFAEEFYNTEYATGLRNSIKTRKEEFRNELDEIEAAVADYKDAIENVLFDNAVKKRYIENWENARMEQGLMKCDSSEKELLDTINKYKSEIDKEIRIHSEIVQYINENQKDMEIEIENWSKRYEKELEERHMEITLLKEKQEELIVKYSNTLVIFDEHKQAIEEWQEYKERKRLTDIKNARQLQASVKIQAWWRGLMVRLELGPYNPKKKKKKGKKK